MGYIDVVGKWNLNNNNWDYNTEYNYRGRSFAFVNYEDIINNKNEGIDYLIFAYGTRVEDCSKDFFTVRDSYMGIDKVIRYFKKLNKNIVVSLFLMDADAPIVEDAKKMAQYIDNLSILQNTNSVNLIGVSKCGAMLFNTPKYFKREISFRKTNLYTVATPFIGTKLASPSIFYPEVERLIVSKLGKNKISDIVYKELIKMYESVSSNSHMDYDISMLGGISLDKLKLYDDSLIKNMFSKDNIDAISRISNYRNLVTGIDNKTLSEAIRTMNFNGIGLCLLNELFFDGKSDGMVTTAAQREIERQIGMEDLKSDLLVSSHHDVASNNRVFGDILYILNDTIDEYNEKVKYRSRKIK